MTKPTPIVLDYPERPQPRPPMPPKQQAMVDAFFEWMAQNPGPMREDGEPLTSIDAIDYPPDVAHPGEPAMIRPSLEIVSEDSGLFAVAREAGDTIGVIGPMDSYDAILAAAVERWPTIEHIDLPDPA